MEKIKVNKWHRGIITEPNSGVIHRVDPYSLWKLQCNATHKHCTEAFTCEMNQTALRLLLLLLLSMNCVDDRNIIVNVMPLLYMPQPTFLSHFSGNQMKKKYPYSYHILGSVLIPSPSKKQIHVVILWAWFFNQVCKKCVRSAAQSSLCANTSPLLYFYSFMAMLLYYNMKIFAIGWQIFQWK